MQRIGEAMKPQTFLLVVASVILALSMSPAAASAAELSTQTAQVIPPGGSGCPSVTASSFIPYVYDNKLTGFDFVVPDPAYVAVAASVGNTGIPFYQMTRRIDAQGNLKMHVDVPSTTISGTVPITITMLSARSNQPVCLASVSTTLVGPSYIPTTSVKPVVPVVSSSPKPKPVVATSTQQSPATSSQVAASSTENPAVVGSVFASIGQAFKGACATPLAAQRTWLILLLAYMLIVGLALWAEYPMAIPSMRTPERVAGIILVLLLWFLGFWYFSAECRTALWMPLVAVLIAILGLLAAFRNHPRVTQLLLIQSTKISS